MSFDLYFRRKDGSAPSIAEVKEYFSSLPRFQVNEVQGELEFVYQNDVTGVYCGFFYSRLDAAELQGCGSTGLTFNLNFNRPSFFAYETMPLVEDFCKRFNLVVENPQDETAEQSDATSLIASWRRHNAAAMKALATEDTELHYLPETSATEWWQYIRVRQALDDLITEDIFVPSPMIVMNSARELFTMLVWPKGIAQFFPRADYVLLQRDKKTLFRTKEETGLVSYDAVIAKIEHLLEEDDFSGLHIKYLRPEKASQIIPMIQSFSLEQVDLRQFTRMAPDSFHDVGRSD